MSTGPRRDATGPLQGIAIGMALAVLVLLVTAFVLREPLVAHFMTGTERAQLLEQADAALAAGDLSRRDGRGARELFLAVQALDPDNARARAGLAATGRAALARAAEHAAAGQVEPALEHLRLSRELGVAEAERVPVERALRASGGGEEALVGLLEAAREAAAARSAGDPPDLALGLFDRAALLAPDNAVVHGMRQRFLDAVVEEASALLALGEGGQALALADAVAAAEPRHPSLPMLRARLSESGLGVPAAVRPGPAGPVEDDALGPLRQRMQAGVAPSGEDATVWRGRLGRHLDAGELTEPEGASALEALMQLDALAPSGRDDRARTAFAEAAWACFQARVATPRLSDAGQCLDALRVVEDESARVASARWRLAGRWLGMAEERLGASERDAAARALAQARRLEPGHPGLPALEDRLLRSALPD